MNKVVYVASIGDPNEIDTFGGTPYYFLRESVRQGFVSKGLSLKANTVAIKFARLAWTLHSVLSGIKYGGFQYSEVFLNAVWRHAGQIEGATIINFFQLYPQVIVHNNKVEKWFYIDQTLNQMFLTYGKPGNLKEASISEILLREREGYISAKGIFVVSQNAKEDLCRNYRIDQNKIFVVPRGANFDVDLYNRWLLTSNPSHCTPENPLRFIFVGRDAYRKGLDRMLAAFYIAEAKGANIELSVVGTEEFKSECKSNKVHWLGHIDKKYDLIKYLEILSSSDVGCLLSRAEAGGISLREFHATGLPVIFPNVGGANCFVMPEASFPIDSSATATVIADLLIFLDNNRDLVQHKKNLAWNGKQEMLWPSGVASIKKSVES
ncbi:glycosyltransferase family 4 protein [Cycloclasticus pugetii]|uniref:glycosyltransferase family 4 protein n=1 Tax=Cycloclasticus pugetii TaxID=34068 RepID=UPI003A8E4977